MPRMNTNKWRTTWWNFYPFSALRSVVKKILLSALLALGARAAEPTFPFAEATIDDLQERMAAGTLTARELTAAYLA
eukprot:gene20930-28717_t